LFEADLGFLPSVLSRRPDLGSARPDTPFGERHYFSVAQPKLDIVTVHQPLRFRTGGAFVRANEFNCPDKVPSSPMK